jgi:hypothetical protein
MRHWILHRTPNACRDPVTPAIIRPDDMELHLLAMGESIPRKLQLPDTIRLQMQRMRFSVPSVEVAG